MNRIALRDVEPGTPGTDAVRRGLSDPLGTTEVALNHYVLAPGDRLAGLHAHFDQEEVFVVTDGRVTFETFVPRDTDAGLSGEGDEIVVGTDGAIRFAPGEFQSGKNAADSEAVLYGLGAPRDTDDWRVPVACHDCGHGNTRPTMAADGKTWVLSCPDCGAEWEIECPECGSDFVRSVLPDDGDVPVSVCQACGAESDSKLGRFDR